MGDISLKKRTSLVIDYILFVQHNAIQLIKSGRKLSQYKITDYLIEELNYTQKDVEEIEDEINEMIKKVEIKINDGKNKNKDSD